MARTRLLQAVCTVAMLAAVPAFAQQTQTPPGATGPNGAPNPAVHPTGPNATSSGSTSMAPATPSGSDSSTAAESHSTHRPMMTHATGGRGRTDSSQNAEVDRLNEQSYQAAQQGQSYGGGASDTGSSARSSGMSPTPGGSMPSNISGGSGSKP